MRKAGATMSWGRDAEPWSWYFAETNRRHPHSYQVWRPRFDEILLEHSAQCGVRVHQGVAIRSVHEGGVALADGSRIEAQMVVDASGQSALVATARDLKEWDTFFRNLAVYGYFEGGSHLEPPDQGNIFIEAYKHGWLWKIPLAGGVSSVGAVVDRGFGTAGIRKVGREPFFRDQIAAAPRSSAMLRGAALSQGPFAVRDWSYCASAMTGPGFVLVGDAACFIDPLFSTGVHLAVSGAHLAAAYVTTALRSPALADAAAESYERLYRTQYRHFHELATLFYASNRAKDSYFWEARRLTGATGRDPRTAFVRAVSGQAAAGYERSVLGHGVLPQDFENAFKEELTAREARRTRPGGTTRVRLAEGLEVRSAAVLGDGCFEAGYVIRGSDRDDLPVSALVASLVHHARGDTLDAIATRIALANAADREPVRNASVAAAELLIADGVLEVVTDGAGSAEDQ